ncbi:MAG: PhoH family protein [Elusimicrobiota bacterium]
MKKTTSKHVTLENNDEALFVMGEQDKNLKNIERHFGVKIYYSQNPVTGAFSLEIKGMKKNIHSAFNEILCLKRDFSAENTNRQQEKNSKTVQQPVQERVINGFKSEKIVYTTYSGRKIRPLSPHQETYVNSIFHHDLVLAIGPAGTGKTFLAVACALSMLDSGKVERIVLTRPVVEAGEKLGFLPGDLYEKVNPYLKPLYDAFYFMLGPERFRRYRDEETIEIVPLAYMRGRTLEDAFIILDEAQNTLPEQMKMFLTRLGFNSQAVVTGDVTQIDLENKLVSGLVLSRQILSNIKEIGFVSFSEEDVVRHRLVKKIIKAYEEWEVRVKG